MGSFGCLLELASCSKPFLSHLLPTLVTNVTCNWPTFYSRFLASHLLGKSWGLRIENPQNPCSCDSFKKFRRKCLIWNFIIGWLCHVICLSCDLSGYIDIQMYNKGDRLDKWCKRLTSVHILRHSRGSLGLKLEHYHFRLKIHFGASHLVFIDM